MANLPEGVRLMSLELVVGNYNYSSWSLRAWLSIELAGVEYQVKQVGLYQPESSARLAAVSPARKVPVLHSPHGLVWDSLSIAEYLAEICPGANLWPADLACRTYARSICAEMHSGFQALRASLPMNMRRDRALESMTEDVRADIDRVCALWRQCREKYGQGGEFLFGSFSLADAYFAPIASRLKSYHVQLPDDARAYVAAIHRWPAFVRWREAALKEEEIIES
jgi:glutathione S-transferase